MKEDVLSAGWLFASRYRLVLPCEEELKQGIEWEKRFLVGKVK
jgi:hypothetical protein